MFMDIVLVEGGRTLGAPIFLAPGWERDETWEKPNAVFCDLSTALHPLQKAFSLVSNAIREH